MKIVKLSAINSTNDFLKDLVRSQSQENWTVVVAESQTEGRGQFRNKWHVEPGKNLTFSVLCDFKDVSVDHAFYLNCATSLAVFKVLQSIIPKKLSIKWPNDIMSGSKKIGGILIENTVSTTRILRAVIGIGLNVNQKDFIKLPKATSIRNVLGKEIDKDVLLEKVVLTLQQEMQHVEDGSFAGIKKRYEAHLYKKNMPSMFEDIAGSRFMGKILGITEEGKLSVELDNDLKKSFDLKTIKFL